MTQLEKWLIAAVLLPMTFSAGANGNELPVFRLQGFGVIQRFGECASGEVSWNPIFSLGSGFGIRGNIGAMLLKGFPDKFLAAEYEARLSYAFNGALAVEAGGGAQTWLQKTAGTSPVFSAGFSWIFFGTSSWLRSGITGGYSVFLPKDNLTHEIRLGVMLAFGNRGKKR